MNEFYDIPGYEGRYKIDKEGNVFSIKNDKILKFKSDGIRYKVVNLWNDRKRVKTLRIHQLMAWTFLDKDYNKKGLVVDHIDDNPLNNNLENLRVVTQRVNATKTIKGISQYIGVTVAPKGKWRANIRINGKRTSLGAFEAELEAHHAYQNKLKEIEEARLSENLSQISPK